MSVTAPVAQPGSAAGASFELSAPSPERCEARGALTFATARRARKLGLAALRNAGRELSIDCGAISQTDSAGLAVLLDWLAEAKRAGCSLRLQRLPQSLLALARISAAEEMLQKGV
jgi:phospholipid transport system transporter-binding protein